MEPPGSDRGPTGPAAPPGASETIEGSVDDPLPTREAYRLWAPSYGRETVVSALEARILRRLTPPLAGRSLLDAGCGTGRRLPPPGSDLRRAVGVDVVPEMLRAGRSEAGARPEVGARDLRDAGQRLLVAGDLRGLPFRSDTFDLVWCRLAMGHVARPEVVYRELARVSTPGAVLVVSDFHPEAAAAGHRRTFRDPAGRVRTVEHYVHTAARHERAGGAAGWVSEVVVHAPAGPESRPFYERAGRLEQYERERSLPLVLAASFWLRTRSPDASGAAPPDPAGGRDL